MHIFSSQNSSIHIIARALLMQGEKIILCREKSSQILFLPGGHVEDGESSKNALIRELREELGSDTQYTISSFIGVAENIFPLKDKSLRHEINIVFKVIIPNDATIATKESHLELIINNKDNLKDLELLPENLKQGLLEWFDNGSIFFKEILPSI